MTSHRAPITAPAQSEVVDRRGVGAFVTLERYLLPDGTYRTWSSRRHRKVGLVHERQLLLDRPWWQPHLLGWWIAILFMVGSLLFALGALPWYADNVDPQVVGVTYFVGSIVFTAAAYLQYVETISAPDTVNVERRDTRHVRLWALQPWHIDWWATSVQLMGTVLFNISTAGAMASQFTLPQQERLVWAPDMTGSIAFLIASTLAWLEVCHSWWRWRPNDVSWQIVALNLLGSIAFQVSALAAFIRPTTGELFNLPLANLGTFAGAVCFFLGAVLLIPEMADRRPVDA
jgi:hypothetical protein